MITVLELFFLVLTRSRPKASVPLSESRLRAPAMLFGGESKKREILKSTDELASLTQVDLGLNYDHREKSEKPVIRITGLQV